MAHRLLIPPVRRMEGRVRLPMIQHPTAAIVRDLQTTLMGTDALRRSGTSRSGVATGPLSPVQVFARGEVWPNDPASMSSGLMVGNARRLSTKTRGQSAGV